MSIKKDTIRYVANLARIELNSDEEKLFAKQLNDILAYMDKINKLDTGSIEPMSHAVSIGNVFREDSVKESLSNEEALKNSPDKKDKFFKVPKVIE
ncbi:MAG: Asp-tRNA(Asn)/Glu-tRNA(Gln) amidotransferase subunit GatC [Candidatus Omnitrophica bacterium]|nr:Asp-tRNA(Asn)/Glu-tRNA(Gln) amidotransferase subunit GatC [Candidatus Omnitrophota bacterium]